VKITTNRRLLLGLPILLLACVPFALGQAQEQTQNAPGTSKDPNAPATVTLQPGTTISVRIADVVDSSHNHTGDLLTGIVDPSVLIDNHVVIPRGTEAHVRLMEDKKGGHIHGKAEVRLELVGLVMNKEKLDVDTDEHTKKQGALSAKLKGTGRASASAGASAATSPTPEGGVVGPIIAVFRAAKIVMPAGTRVDFKLTDPFTFDEPIDPTAADSSRP
jgi:hypothetical protein